MLYSEIIAVCSQIHVKHINTLCGLNVEFFTTYLVQYIKSLDIKRGMFQELGNPPGF